MNLDDDHQSGDDVALATKLRLFNLVRFLLLVPFFSSTGPPRPAIVTVCRRVRVRVDDEARLVHVLVPPTFVFQFLFLKLFSFFLVKIFSERHNSCELNLSHLHNKNRSESSQRIPPTSVSTDHRHHREFVGQDCV